MTTTDALLAAVIEEPDEDAPRLVLADWLDEHGDSDRAEFVRVQIERDRLPPRDPRRGVLRKREGQLLARHRAEWRACLPRGMKALSDFRRGFIAQVVCNPARWRKEGAAVRARTPLETVCVSIGQLTEALTLPHAAGLEVLVPAAPFSPADELPPAAPRRHVEIRSGHWAADSYVRELARSPLLAGLTTLGITDSGVTDGAVGLLARSPHAAELRYLDLSGNPIGDAALEALASSPHLRGLRVLRLAHIHATPRGVRALVGSRYLANLVALDLRENCFGDSAGHDPQVPLALLSSRSLGGLRYLDLTVEAIWRRYAEEVRAALRERFGDALFLDRRELAHGDREDHVHRIFRAVHRA
jgi:uncharacterized protein (TIGR02996 family)